jgi:hypothetical protein
MDAKAPQLLRRWMTENVAPGMLSIVPGIRLNQFEVVVRPLRDHNGPRRTVRVETRTAVQASREVTARFPEMKVISVTRVSPSVASITTAQTQPLASDPASPACSAVDSREEIVRRSHTNRR